MQVTPRGNRELADEANELGRICDDEGRVAEAIAHYERACSLDPSYSIPCFNLGLVHKYAGDWERSIEWNRRAVALDPESQGAWWNLAIAATALERWDLAREAWQGFGLEIPPGEGPVDYPCGLTPIRLDPQGAAEVVWAERLDPARALIKNVPLPESGFRFHDLVLNDGAAVGYRRLGDREAPVFNCLALLAPSGFSTWVAGIEAAGGLEPQAVARLAELAFAAGLAAENWSTSLRVLCTACSEGRPHERHEGCHTGGDEPAPLAGRQRIGLAARSLEEARGLLEAWRGEVAGIEVVSLERALAAEVM